MQIQRELDIEDEEFVQPQELIEYFNSAIRLVESEIVKMGLRDNYLRSEAYISTVSGQQDYTLPADIIDAKIRKLVYRENNTIYTLKPLKTEQAYEAEDTLNLYTSSDYYYYMVYKVGFEYKLRLVPKPVRSVTNAIRIIYWKDLNRYTVDADECDVPEICYEYIMSYVRLRVYLKEPNASAGGEQQMLASLLELMRETLQGQVADPEMDLIDQDLSHYGESS
jgi:hypothetical protein